MRECVWRWRVRCLAVVRHRVAGLRDAVSPAAAAAGGERCRASSSRHDGDRVPGRVRARRASPTILMGAAAVGRCWRTAGGARSNRWQRPFTSRRLPVSRRFTNRSASGTRRGRRRAADAGRVSTGLATRVHDQLDAALAADAQRLQRLRAPGSFTSTPANWPRSRSGGDCRLAQIGVTHVFVQLDGYSRRSARRHGDVARAHAHCVSDEWIVLSPGQRDDRAVMPT